MASVDWIKTNFPGYAGWNDSAAILADFNATGGAGKGGGGGGGVSSGTQPGGDYVSQLIQTLTGQVVPQALEFDTEAARRAAEQEWNPYYDELLSDYLAGVAKGKTREGEDLATYLKTLGTTGARAQENLTTQLEALGLSGTRAGEDLTELLGLLGGRREEYLGGIARESPLIQEQIGGSAADRGLYFSGSREEQQRLQLEKEARDKATYEKEYGYQTGQAQSATERTLADIEKRKLLEQQQLGRTQEDLAKQEEARRLESTRYFEDAETQRKARERELARAREEAIAGGVQTRREEALLGY